MIRLKTILLLLAIPILTFCQNNWQKVGIVGFDWPVRYLYKDSVNNLLYASGTFEYADNINVNEIAMWNGINWDSLGHGAITSGVYAMTNYNGSFYASGNFLNDWGYMLGYWNGNNWDTTGIELNDNALVFKSYNN